METYKKNDDVDTEDPKIKKLLGKIRFDKEITEIGCLLMLTGLPEIIQPLTWICGLINGGMDADNNPSTVTTGLPMGILFGYLCCVLIGVLALLVGYAAAFHKAGKAWITIAVSIFVQSAYILTVTSCMKVTRVAQTGGSYEVPAGSFEFDEPNAGLLAAMGVLAIIAYWFGMLGSISVLLGALAKFQQGKPHERDGNYYRGRLFFYSFVLFLGGATQLVVGAYLESFFNLKGGSLPNGAFYKVAMLIITYPSMSIVVGAVQVFNGLWGMLRQLGAIKIEDGGAFVSSIWAGWFIQLVLQIIVQPSVVPGIATTRFPPELAAFAFGMNFMPAYLDAKAKSLPEAIEPEYYGFEANISEEEKASDEPPQHTDETVEEGRAGNPNKEEVAWG